MTCEVSKLESVGSRYRDFVVTKLLPIDGLRVTLREITHEPTGVEVMHVANDDEENIFCLSFRTLPENCNGVPHILEHTVLCGSERFPVKDPFFSMNRRSLNTYMNALTSADFTCYPAGSQVTKDFYNLLDVYLDAVFKPNLKATSFAQEGHRFEFLEKEDSSSPLVYKGVVFNEMKGAYASPDRRLWNAFFKELMPDLPYAFDAGGDPKEIPELTYEQLLEFHRYYYHPSRCLFYFYGNLPIEPHLDFIEERVLRGVEKLPVVPSIAKQKRFLSPVRSEMRYPSAALSDQEMNELAMVAMGWLTCEIKELDTLLALAVLDILLMGTDAAPLKQAFLQSGLCKQVSACLDEEVSEAPFLLMLKGCNPENGQKLEDLLMKTLSEIKEEGFDEERIESAIHQLEFHRTEITEHYYPYGLLLFMRSAPLKQLGGDAEVGLQVHSLFNKLREQVKDPSYLISVMEKYLIENPHFVRIVMRPDASLIAEEEKEEKQRLELINQKLSEEEKKKLVEQAVLLEKLQDEEEDLEVLPKVTLADVPVESMQIPLRSFQDGEVTFHHHACTTNEIVYADLLFDLPSIAESDLSDVSLFSGLLSEIGCGGRDYQSHLEYVEAHTGGVGVSLSLHSHVEDFNRFTPSFSLRGKALHRKADRLFPLMRDLLLSADFSDKKRLKELLLKQYTSIKASLSSNAMRYANSQATRFFSHGGSIGSYWYGLEYYWNLKEWAENFDSRADQFVEKMQELQQTLLSFSLPQLVLSCEEKMFERLQNQNFYAALELPIREEKTWKGEMVLPTKKGEGRVIAAPVAFTTLALPGIPYQHEDSPLLSIAARIFTNKTLHKRIREQGGAYGSGATNNAFGGTFYFYGFRDPHLLSSLEAFREAVDEVAEGRFDEEDIEQAKLGIIQGMDSPIMPGSRGIVAYSREREGRTDEVRQRYRDAVLSSPKEKIQGAVKRHLLERWEEGVVVSFAGEELLEKENKKLKERGMEELVVSEV